MSSRNADVNLIVRAKTEGEQAITSLADAVQHLINGAGTGSSKLSEFGKTIAALDKAAAGLATAQDKVGSSAAKQASAIHEATAGIAAQQARIDELKRGIGILAAEADKAFIGPRRNGLADLLRVAKSELSDAERQLNRFSSSFDRNLAALQTSRSGLLDLGRSTREVTAAQEAAQTAVAATTAELQRQQRASEALAAIQRTQPAPSGKSAADSAAVFARSGLTGVEQDFAAADALRAKLNPLGVLQARFNAELERYRTLAAAGRITTDELAAAEAHLRKETDDAAAALKRQGAGGAFKATLFGLKPYELQNLSYQINDVITGLASGQRLTQVIAQQGGQILQLFPRVGGVIVGALGNPVILGFVATMGLAVLALKNAADQAERLRSATADLGRRANGGDYQATDIASQERDLQHLGATAEQARAALGTFIDAGVPAQSLSQFGRVAKEVSDILGVDLPQAAQQVTTAFTGGYQAIAELDNKLNFLTGAQRDHIRQLFEEGQAQQAQTEALNIFTQKMDTAAGQARGPWADANRDLSRSWHDLLDALSNSSVIKVASGFINGLAAAVKGLADAIDDISSRGDLTEMSSDLAQIQAMRRALADPNYEQRSTFNSDFIKPGTSRNYTREELKQQIAHLIEEYNAAAQRNNRTGLNPDGSPVPAAQPRTQGPTSQGDSPLARQRHDQILAITDEEALQKLRDDGSQRMLTAAEQLRRVQLAGAIAFRQEQDAAVGAVRRQLAAEHEKAQIQKETKAALDRQRADAQRAAQEREQTIKRYLERIVAAEGGSGRNAAGSSATGPGQFTRGTFIDVYRSANPGTQLNNDQIADLRNNSTVAAQILDIFTRQNAQFLANLHQTITGANLYLIHFLGQHTGAAVLRASGDTPVDQIIRANDPNAAAVLKQNRGYLYNQNGSAKTRDQLLSFLGNRVGDAAGIGGDAYGGAVLALQRGEAEREKQDLARQAELDLAVKHSNEDRQRGIDAAREQQGKFGTDLIDVQRTQAGAAAVDQLRQHVEELNRAQGPGHSEIIVTDEQVKSVKQLAEALFDVQHAQEEIAAQRDALQRPIDDLTEQRQLLEQQADLLRSMGDTSGAKQVQDQVDAITPKIQAAYDALIAFNQALSPEQRVQLGILDEQQLDNIIAKLQVARDTAAELPRVMGVSGNEFLSAFSGAAANAFENFIKNVAQGKNVFKSFAEGVAEFVASFARSMAEAILKTLAFLAALEVLSAITHIPVSVLAKIASAGASVHHTGGIVGQGTGQSRAVSPLLFAGAMRYHTGGIIGLAPDEQAAILRKGEEVLTEADPRHRNNGGLDSGSQPSSGGNVHIYTLFKEEDLAERLLSTRAGEKKIINIVRDNPAAFKAALS